jgi:hypothetical protein
MMRNNIINILLILISILSLSLTALAGDKVDYMTPDESAEHVRLVSGDLAVLLFGYPDEDSSEESPNTEKGETANSKFPDDVGIYCPQQAVFVNYEGSYPESYFMDAVIEDIIKDINLPESGPISTSDYKGLIGQMTGLSPQKAGRETLAKALHILAKKSNRPNDYRTALSSVDQEIRNNMDLSAEALERTSFASKNELKQKAGFLKGVRLKAELSATPALLLALLPRAA